MPVNVETFLMEEPTDPWGLLPSDRWQAAVAIRDFMLGPGRLEPDQDVPLSALAGMYVDAGLPLDRCVTIVRLLHAESVASVRVWERGAGVSSFTFPYSAASEEGYQASPPALAHAHKRWVKFNPQDLDDNVFTVVRELKDAGITHYICAPVFLVNGMQNVFTFATKTPGGFSDEDILFLRATFPALAACQEILVVHRMLKEVTRMYVGEEPHKRILEGDVHRGEVTRILSAILFADMRGFTSLTADMSAEDATALLNDYYDCVVPAIERNGGEVLKFIGDGVLAIFRAENDGVDACARALDAAKAGIETVDGRDVNGSPAFEIGIALHFGEVAYGNVGSGLRLDYTVIGRDVNLAARVAGLCSELEQPLLVSSEFRERLPKTDFTDCGTYNLKGLLEPVTVFAP